MTNLQVRTVKGRSNIIDKSRLDIGSVRTERGRERVKLNHKEPRTNRQKFYRKEKILLSKKKRKQKKTLLNSNLMNLLA